MFVLRRTLASADGGRGPGRGRGVRVAYARRRGSPPRTTPCETCSFAPGALLRPNEAAGRRARAPVGNGSAFRPVARYLGLRSASH
jgi:hypothetical protein